MRTLAALFVSRPFNILAVALLFAAVQLGLRLTGSSSTRHPWAMTVVALSWLIYAAWEWLVLVRTPEADIRVDLLVIWPVLAVVSIWFTVKAFR